MNPFHNVRSASIKEKLKVLDTELKTLRVKCKKAGYSPEKIRKIAKSVIQTSNRGYWKIRGKQCIKCLIILFALYTLASWKFVNRPVAAISKRVMTNYILPHYDWTWLWEEECILQNPFYSHSDADLVTAKCEVCRNLKNLSVLHDVNHTYMTKTIFTMEPTLIGDGAVGWPSMKQTISLDDVMQSYLTNPNLNGVDHICNLRVTKGLDLHASTIQDLFRKVKDEIKSGRQGNFTAKWSACHKNSSREMHKYYYQPYFLPGMCEPTKQSTYVLLGRKAAAKSKAILMHIEGEELGYWIGQLHGTMEIVLMPADVCEKICRPIKLLLDKGQILNIPHYKLFEVAFRPSSDEAIAIGVGYTYN